MLVAGDRAGRLPAGRAGGDRARCRRQPVRPRRALPARPRGQELDTGGMIELLLGWLAPLSDRLDRGPAGRGRPAGLRRLHPAGAGPLPRRRRRLPGHRRRRACAGGRPQRGLQRRAAQAQPARHADRDQGRLGRGARSYGMAGIVSARSGESEDVTIVHLAVGWGADQLKVGSFSRSERMAKWNEGLRIEEALGERARFAGREALAAARVLSEGDCDAHCNCIMTTDLIALAPAWKPADEPRLWRKLVRVAARITFADSLVAAWYCAMDPATPMHVRGIMLAALAYFLLPLDAVPDIWSGSASPTTPPSSRPCSARSPATSRPSIAPRPPSDWTTAALRAPVSSLPAFVTFRTSRRPTRPSTSFAVAGWLRRMRMACSAARAMRAMGGVPLADELSAPGAPGISGDGLARRPAAHDHRRHGDDRLGRRRRAGLSRHRPGAVRVPDAGRAPAC